MDSGIVLVFDDDGSLFGSIPYEEVRQTFEYENKRSMIQVVMDYSNHRYTQCRDSKSFKISKFPKVNILKDNVKIENSMIVISGHVTDEQILGLEVI